MERNHWNLEAYLKKNRHSKIQIHKLKYQKIRDNSSTLDSLHVKE